MITFPNNTILVQSLSELPRIRSSKIVLDTETTSGDSKTDSLNPWHNCSVAGICICDFSDSPGYYIPVNHRHPTPNEPNLDKSQVILWLREVLSHADTLYGHNIKYDAHVLENDFGIVFEGVLWDTLTQAKIIDSDRLSYSLDALARDWLGKDISQYEGALSPYLFDGKGNRVNKDYGSIPAIVMAPYGGQDVLSTRDLVKYIQLKMPGACKLVSENEIKLTKILLNLENTGLRVNPSKVIMKQATVQWEMLQIMQRINEITGIDIRPNTTDDCYNFLCGQYGLPILKWTNEEDDSKSSNPSFDKEAMSGYLIHPQVQSDPVLKESVELIQTYRTLHTFDALFLNTFIDRNIQGILHSTYNQAVRTARLSCSDPNAQQMSSLAKELIEVEDDWMIVDIDLSQIEFRLIASTLNNDTIVKAYNSDPYTDYHKLVAKMADLGRKPAKNLNFAVAFAAGKKKAVSMVKGSLDISSQGYLDSGLPFDTYCQMKAESMYADYHKMLPELKPIIKQSEKIAKQYGYIANLYGRWRRLPYQGCYKAFNAYIQSSAADLAKHLTILINELICNQPLVKLVGVVHDSWVLYMHKSVYMQYCIEISRIIRSLKTPGVLRVPILSSCEVSKTNWRDCKPIPNFEFAI